MRTPFAWPAVGRQRLFASLERAPFAGWSSGRPVWPPSSLDRGSSAVWHCFSGLRGGADPYPVAACSVRAGCERRNADAKQPRDPRTEFLWRGERPRDRHMGGDRSRCGRDRTCPWRVAHRCRQLAPRSHVPLSAAAIVLASRYVDRNVDDTAGSLMVRWSAGHGCFGPCDLGVDRRIRAGLASFHLRRPRTGLILELLFLSAELRLGDRAMMPLTLFGSASFVGLTLFASCCTALSAGCSYRCPVCDQAGGYTATQAGAALLPLPLVIAVASAAALVRWRPGGGSHDGC